MNGLMDYGYGPEQAGYYNGYKTADVWDVLRNVGHPAGPIDQRFTGRMPTVDELRVYDTIKRGYTEDPDTGARRLVDRYGWSPYD